MGLIGASVGVLSMKDGKVTVAWNQNQEPQKCDCGLYTRETYQGFPECSVCKAFEYSTCKKCEHGIPRSNFICDGEDIDDHVEHYTACGIRDHFGNILPVFNPDSTASGWDVGVEERKKCFKNKVTGNENEKNDR